MRWVWFIIYATLGAILLVAGWLIPAHVRAVDAHVLRLAGQKSLSVAAAAQALLAHSQVGAAQLLAQAAQAEQLSEREPLNAALTNFARAHPEMLSWGGPPPALAPQNFNPQFPTFAAALVHRPNREAALQSLERSPLPLARELLHCRTLTNTVLLPPSGSPAGQAFDTAVAMFGLLALDNRLTPAFQADLLTQAKDALYGARSARLEQSLLDLLSLGQRLNWGQAAVFVESIQSAETLRLLTDQIHRAEASLPQLYAAVYLSAAPDAVAGYLRNFSETGLKDLAASLSSGAGGVKELLRRNQRLCQPGLRQAVAAYVPFGSYFRWAAGVELSSPHFALGWKWFCYLASGFLLAVALHVVRPAASALERPLQVRGFHLAREFLFALGFLLVILLLSEPFLSQENQKVELPFRLRLPTTGAAVPAGNHAANAPIMNQLSLLTLLLFFVLQSLLYIACLVKLAEIRRQNLLPRLKLKLLENEDHLFDAGLYLGFVGTIISLILVSLGVIKPSLMAAYSSTSFGIIYVSVFKIFHLRPLRRNLLLAAEAESPQAANPAPVVS